MKPIEFKNRGFGKTIDNIHEFFCMFNDDKNKSPFYFNGLECYYLGVEKNNENWDKTEFVFEADLCNDYTKEEKVGRVEIRIPYKSLITGNVTFYVGWDE